MALMSGVQPLAFSLREGTTGRLLDLTDRVIAVLPTITTPSLLSELFPMNANLQNVINSQGKSGVITLYKTMKDTYINQTISSAEFPTDKLMLNQAPAFRLLPPLNKQQYGRYNFANSMVVNNFDERWLNDGKMGGDLNGFNESGVLYSAMWTANWIVTVQNYILYLILKQIVDQNKNMKLYTGIDEKFTPTGTQQTQTDFSYNGAIKAIQAGTRNVICNDDLTEPYKTATSAVNSVPTKGIKLMREAVKYLKYLGTGGIVERYYPYVINGIERDKINIVSTYRYIDMMAENGNGVVNVNSMNNTDKGNTISTANYIKSLDGMSPIYDIPNPLQYDVTDTAAKTISTYEAVFMAMTPRCGFYAVWGEQYGANVNIEVNMPPMTQLIQIDETISWKDPATQQDTVIKQGNTNTYRTVPNQTKLIASNMYNYLGAVYYEECITVWTKIAERPAPAARR